MRLGERQLGQASLKLGKSDALPEHLQAVIEVSDVFVPKEERKKGYASQLLELVAWEADKAGIVLMLMPDGMDWLPAWYEKHGFVTIQHFPEVLMARKPTHDRQNTH